MISEGFKKLIYTKLHKELGKVEIIGYYDDIWLIDREEKEWYFEFKKDGTLWWNYRFFNSFFHFFSLERPSYEPIIIEWVEQVLNHKVSTSYATAKNTLTRVEQVLNHKVSTSNLFGYEPRQKVEEVLNHKVSTTDGKLRTIPNKVGEILNHKFV